MKLIYFLISLILQLNITNAETYQRIDIYFDTIEDRELFIQQANDNLPGQFILTSDSFKPTDFVVFQFDKPYNETIISQLIQQTITANYRKVVLSKYHIEFVEH